MSQDGEVDSQASQWYGVREATLFLVDCTEKMFMHSSDIDDRKITYIEKFFKLYKQILRQKLAWSMQDWMGMVLFGTEKNDANSPWTNIQTLQELKVVTVDDLQRIRKLTKSNMKGYESMKLKNNALLLDTLTYATDIFLKIKPVLTKRRIVLITCYNPDYSDDEKHCIRAKAKSLKELDLNLYVIDLRNNWPLDEFYKDLEILSRKIEIGVYRRTSLIDLVQQIKAPSKNIACLSFQICDGVEIDLAVRTLGRKRRCLQTKPLSKATNQVLSRLTYFKDINFDEEDSDNEESNLPFMIPEEVNLETEESIGGKKLHFTQKELLQIKQLYPPAIKIIGVRPIPGDLFRYHVKRKYFVRADYGSTRKDNLLFFSALLNKCATKNKMIVCAFTMRLNTQTNLCYMIPNAELGGFYLSKVAFQGNIEDKSEALLRYDMQNSVTDKEVALWEKTIDRLDMDYRPYNFRSYKLECQIQIVEKLALDKEPGPPPIDSIEKSYLMAKQKTNDLISEFDNMYPDIFINDGLTKVKRARKK
ncbi:ATP-dependent DNA helicase II subunit 1 isoform X1 [Mycetomoellerius zeteki]|uniref:ATP-dependent DNA helicase II subunit 1 isoform X1 n=1 Tax=Mycetomoellerius zeteki TaxID=64791 RepID=UPI00084EC202|nr:PREDICTED: ATP-dependent DNA helicase II subunit 1-like isoform X1 [Trachymyrmex zeteki]XP_018307421.1 PREDICTED: ATP-dependent DNA helicase II subunit 1-like isoform X1 [Trachymyrmex zeteki]